MADNTTLNPAQVEGGDVIASDDVNGVKFQRVKLTLGGDGQDQGDVHAGNRLPVAVQFPATQQVSGTVALDAASLAALETVNANVSGTVALDAATLAALESVNAAVTGTVAVNNLPAVQATTDSTDTEYLRVATSVMNAGDTTLVTPAAGKRIRLQWVYAVNDPVASSSTLITIKLGTSVQYVAWAISKRQQLTGPVDGALIVNLSAPGNVAVTVFYQEV
jgi:hypothetical protein